MKSLAARWLLVVALVLNGPGTAWSMHHYGQNAHEAAKAEQTDHAHCADLQTRNQAAGQQQHPFPSTSHAQCGGGSSCHCGCATVAIAPFVVIRDLPRWVMDARGEASQDVVSSHRATPPFRPPAA